MTTNSPPYRRIFPKRGHDDASALAAYPINSLLAAFGARLVAIDKPVVLKRLGLLRNEKDRRDRLRNLLWPSICGAVCGGVVGAVTSALLK